MITLKGIKHSRFASQETHCYQASIFFDGKRAGTVANSGHGGCDDHQISDKNVWNSMIDYVNSLPEEDTSIEGFRMKPDLETICGRLVNEFLARKDLKRLLKCRVVVRKPGGQLIQTQTNISPVVLKKWGEQFMAEDAGNVVLNTLDFETALKLFMGDK